MKKGNHIVLIKKRISINILCFNLFHPNDKNYKKYFHTLFAYEPGDLENSMRNQIYIYIELPRFKYENFDKSNILHKWLAFLKAMRVTSEEIKDEDIGNRKIKSENIDGKDIEIIIKKI